MTGTLAAHTDAVFPGQTVPVWADMAKRRTLSEFFWMLLVTHFALSNVKKQKAIHLYVWIASNCFQFSCGQNSLSLNLYVSLISSHISSDLLTTYVANKNNEQFCPNDRRTASPPPDPLHRGKNWTLSSKSPPVSLVAPLVYIT